MKEDSSSITDQSDPAAPTQATVIGQVTQPSNESIGRQALSGLRLAFLLVFSCIAYLGTAFSTYQAISTLTKSPFDKNDPLTFFFLGGFLVVILVTPLVISIVSCVIALSLNKSIYKLNRSLLEIALIVNLIDLIIVVWRYINALC